MNGWIHKTGGAFRFYAIAQRREHSPRIEGTRLNGPKDPHFYLQIACTVLYTSDVLYFGMFSSMQNN